MTKRYKIRLKILSPLITPLMGDTLFGHICWGIVYYEGEKRLKEFLCSFNDNSPALVLSNGFPANMLPFPLLKPDFSGDITGLKDIEEKKELKKKKFLPVELFTSPTFNFSEEKLLTWIGAAKEQEERKPGGFQRVERLHNTINRLTGTTEEGGGLFPVTEQWCRITGKEEGLVDLYAVSTETKERISELFKNGLESGYGADKSTGKGDIRFYEINEVEFPEGGGREMALGAFVPSEEDSLEHLRADIFTKFGKLGGDYLYSKNPFKKPIVMYREGATFLRKTGRKFVGRLLGNVHVSPEIKHHAFAPVIPFQEG